MKKCMTVVFLISLLLDSSQALSVPKEKLIDAQNDLRRAEDFVSADHLQQIGGSEYFLQERLKEINRLRLVLKNKQLNPDSSLDKSQIQAQEEGLRADRSKKRLSASLKVLSAKGVASIEAYGKDFIKYKDGKVLRVVKGLITTIENEKVYDKRGNKYVRNTSDIVYDDLKRIVSYKEESFSPDGKTKTVLTKKDTSYYTEEDEKLNSRCLTGNPESFTEIEEVYNEETGDLVSSSKKRWGDICYYAEGESDIDAGYAAGQMSSYTLTEYVSTQSNAVGAVTLTADIKYSHRLKYVNELTFSPDIDDSDLKESQRYEYLVTSYRENYTPKAFSGVAAVTVLENIEYNNYGEFYSYKERVSTSDYTLTRTVSSIDYDSFGNVIRLKDTSSISFGEDEFFQQFARDYSTDDIAVDAALQSQFIDEYLTAEGAFHQAGISYNAENGMTYDSYDLNADTGGVAGIPNGWSAASNESLHIQILAAAIAGNENAQKFISPDDPSRARDLALEILTLKMDTLEQFYTANPKYAGFLPWFVHSGNIITPAEDWFHKVPSLDNGQLAWSLIMTEKVLLDAGENALSDRYRIYWQRMANNSKNVFWDGAGTNKIRGVAGVAEGPPGVFTYTDNDPAYALVDPYEGEIMVLFMSLFSTLTPGEIDAIWANKNMSASTYTTADGDDITVRTGHWYSSHEMWNFFLLPYTDDPLVSEVFRLGEIARIAYSAENGIPGLYASVNPPEGVTLPPGETYASACGIASLANNAIQYPEIITPYAAFPVILADQGVGLSWLINMLQGAKAQGPYGTTESMTVDGTSIANVLSWDSKAILVNALISDTIHSTMRTVMQDKGVYANFIGRINTAYTGTFTNLASLDGRHLSLSLFTPNTPLPRPATIMDFVSSENILRGISFVGGGDMAASFTFDSSAGRLYIPNEDGFVYAYLDPFDISENSALSFTVVTNEDSAIWVELKNGDDNLITKNKIRVMFPNTGGAEKTFTANLNQLELLSDARVSVIAFSETNAEIYINNVFFRSTEIPGTDLLKYKSTTGEFYSSPSYMSTATEENLFTPVARVNSYGFETGGYEPLESQEVIDILFDGESAKAENLIKTAFVSPVSKSQSTVKPAEKSAEQTSYSDEFIDNMDNHIKTEEKKDIPVYYKGASKLKKRTTTVK